ncbi:uncharacterized protein LOC144153684 isoform X4 [Haemaphysalis longicornis]
MGGPRNDLWFIFSSLLLFASPCHGQKLNAIESNGVFFSGLPRPPSEINAIAQKGGDFFGNTLGPGISGKFTTISPGKSGSTPADFKFNSAKPDNRFAVTGGRAQPTFVTRPTFFTGNPQAQTTPRLPLPSTPRPTTPRLPAPSNVTTRLPAPFFRKSKEVTSQGRPELTTRPPAPVFVPNATPPPQRSPKVEFTTRQPAPVFVPNTAPPSQRQASVLSTGTTTKTTTLRPTTRLVPLSVFNPGTSSSTTTTARPTTRLATLRFVTHFSTFRPATRTPTSRPATKKPTQDTGSAGVTSTGSGLNFAFCDRARCDKVCRERFGQTLNSSSCLKNACKCDVLETCRASVCLEMCRKTNPVQDVLSADCLGNNCRCALNRVCDPGECRQRCLQAHGNKLISADCARRNACQCVHS